MRSTLIKIILLILIIASIGFYVFNQKNTQQQTAHFLTIKPGDITRKATTAGRIIPNRETIITAPYAGYIKKIYVKTGDTIPAEAPLVSVAQSLQEVNETIYPIKAPYAGKVVLVNKSEGQYVNQTTSNDDPIMTIDDLNPLYVQADVTEADIAAVHQGQTVIIKPSSSVTKTYHGTVETVAEAPLPQQSNIWGGQQQVSYPVKIKIDDADHQQLYPGMSVIADIIIEHKKDVLILPHEYLRHNDQGYYVILSNGQHANVATGLQTPQDVEITSGLKSGDQVKRINYFDE